MITHRCSICGSTTLILVALTFPRPEKTTTGCWSLRCGNGHPYLPIPGAEITIEFGEEG